MASAPSSAPGSSRGGGAEEVAPIQVPGQQQDPPVEERDTSWIFVGAVGEMADVWLNAPLDPLERRESPASRRGSTPKSTVPQQTGRAAPVRRKSGLEDAAGLFDGLWGGAGGGLLVNEEYDGSGGDDDHSDVQPGTAAGGRSSAPKGGVLGAALGGASPAPLFSGGLRENFFGKQSPMVLREKPGENDPGKNDEDVVFPANREEELRSLARQYARVGELGWWTLKRDVGYYGGIALVPWRCRSSAGGKREILPEDIGDTPAQKPDDHVGPSETTPRAKAAITKAFSVPKARNAGKAFAGKAPPNRRIPPASHPAESASSSEDDGDPMASLFVVEKKRAAPPKRLVPAGAAAAPSKAPKPPLFHHSPVVQEVEEEQVPSENGSDSSADSLGGLFQAE